VKKVLSSDQTRCTNEAHASIDTIADPREKAFALFLIRETLFAVEREGYEPIAPIDCRYIVEIARVAFRKRWHIETILNGNLDNLGWD
jgi:hypothetical protein